MNELVIEKLLLRTVHASLLIIVLACIKGLFFSSDGSLTINKSQCQCIKEENMICPKWSKNNEQIK